MAIEAVSGNPATTCAMPRQPGQALVDYWSLTKPDVNVLIAVTTFAGFYLARPTPNHSFPFLRLAHTLLGTLLVAGGTGTLNQYVERRYDAQMRRTARRPLAAGRLRPFAVLWFGITLSTFGVIYLAVATNLLASALAVLTLISYLFVYTPLKRRTPLCTLAGAFPGAMPPLIGWAAASGKLSLEAWMLYGIVFLWQFPHFMAIAWMYREDYARAGYWVLPAGERRVPFMIWQNLAPSLVLIPLTLIPNFLGPRRAWYWVGASLLSLALLHFAAQLALHKSNTAARRLLFVSILYIPLVFFLILLDTF
jgi:protoheme IX farnesyltransferase